VRGDRQLQVCRTVKRCSGGAGAAAAAIRLNAQKTADETGERGSVSCTREEEVEPTGTELVTVNRRNHHVDLNLLHATNLHRVDDVVRGPADSTVDESGDDVCILRTGHVTAHDDDVANARLNVNIRSWNRPLDDRTEQREVRLHRHVELE